MNSIGEAPGHSPKHLYMINAVDGWSKRFDAVVLTPTWEANSTRHSSGRGCRHPSCGWKRLSVAPTIHQARSQIFLRLYFRRPLFRLWSVTASHNRLTSTPQHFQTECLLKSQAPRLRPVAHKK